MDKQSESTYPQNEVLEPLQMESSQTCIKTGISSKSWYSLLIYRAAILPILQVPSTAVMHLQVLILIHGSTPHYAAKYFKNRNSF